MTAPAAIQEATAFNTANIGDREAVRRAQMAAQLWSSTQYQAGTGRYIPLVCAGAHYVPDQYWEAGRTPEPPRCPAGALPSNILDDQGEYWYDGVQLDPAGAPYVSTQGAEPGHAWPYMSPGPLLERQDPNVPGVGTGQWYPAAIINQGINHYRRGWPYRKWMFGRRGGAFEATLCGVITANDATNPTRAHCVEVMLAPNFTSSWQAGAGGTASSPGQFATTRTLGCRSPDFTYTMLEIDGGAGSALFKLEIEGDAVYRGISFWSFRWTLCRDGLSSPFWEETRLVQFSTTALNFDLDEGNFAFLFKVDGKSPTTQSITYTGLTGTIVAGDAVSKGGITGTVISHDTGTATILVGRINNSDFGTSGTLTGPTGSCTIVTSTDSYQPLGRINNGAWSATPGAGIWPPNVVQDGTAAVCQADFFAAGVQQGF